MNTFIFNLKDTTALSDSAVVELAKVVSGCQPMTEAETNCNDVTIVAIVCLAIVLVALIVSRAFLSFKSKEIEAEKAERESKEANSIRESERKQKADCLGKLLGFLEKNTIKEDYYIEIDKTIKTLRGIKSDESKLYIDVLKKYIEDGHITNQKKENENEE